MAGFTTPPAAAFFESAAQALCQRHPRADLSGLTVFVPTTRNLYALQTALAEDGKVHGFNAMAMPTMLVPSPKNLLALAQGMGYQAPQNPDISDNTRLTIMVKLVAAYADNKPFSQQLAMAENLLQVHDTLTQRGIVLQDMAALVPSHLARHWQQNTEFLQLAFGAYRQYLTENSLTDAALNHAAVLAFLAKQTPPQNTYLLGFNSAFDGWENVMAAWGRYDHSTFITHAHGTDYAQEKLGLENLTALPTEVSEKSEITKPTCVPCPSPMLEIETVVALAKQALLAGEPCTVISPDIAFLRQLQNHLKQYGVVPYQSFNVPLNHDASVQKLLAWVQVLADGFSPESLFAFLPHWHAVSPSHRYAFDQHLLRGMHLETGLESLQKKAAYAPQPVQQVVGELSDLAKPFMRLKTSASGWATKLQQFMGDDAEQVQAHHLLEHLETLDVGTLSAETLLVWLSHFARRPQTQRPTVTHENIQLWDPLEARLLPLEGTVICSSLTAEKWPALPQADMWLNRTLKQQLGLPLPEHIIQTAQADFAQLMAECQAAGAAVHLTHTTQTSTGEATPSAVLNDIATTENTTVCEALQQHTPHLPDLPPAVGAHPQPAAHGMAHSLPTTWHAKTLEQLMNCPYQTYSEKMLHLKAWERVNEPSDAAFRGSLVHALLENLYAHSEKSVRINGVVLQPYTSDWVWANAEAIQTHYAQTVDTALRPLPDALQAAWRGRLKAMMQAAVAENLKWRTEGWQQTAAETTWQHALETPHGETITFKAKLDRVENHPEHGTIPLDYKTGQPPSGKALESGEAPQLPLAAWLGQQQGVPITAVEFWKLNLGKGDALKRHHHAQTPESHTAIAEGLANITTHYTSPNATLPAVPCGACTHCAFAPLCRKKEWINQASVAVD